MAITKDRVNIETCNQNRTPLSLGQSSTFTYYWPSWMAAITCWFGLQDGLVYRMVWFTLWFGLHVGSVYMLVWFTWWFGLQDGSVYILVWYTGWFGLHAWFSLHVGFGLHVVSIYRMVRFSCWFGLQDGLVYMLVQLHVGLLHESYAAPI